MLLNVSESRVSQSFDVGITLFEIAVFFRELVEEVSEPFFLDSVGLSYFLNGLGIPRSSAVNYPDVYGEFSARIGNVRQPLFP